jgi:2Fe-2S ferredoxin
MTTIIYRGPDGAEHTVDASDGMSVMESAMIAGIDGILAECGGNITCSTCHVYIDAAGVDVLSPVSEYEDDLLDCVASERLPTSRLSCQVIVSKELEGLVVQIPERQI